MKFHREIRRSLAQIVAMYHIGFRIRPIDREAVSKTTTQMTCRLELLGRHSRHIQRNDRTCQDCTHILEGLFAVLDALRPIERETLAKAGVNCTFHARFALAGAPEHEVRLDIEIALEHAVAGLAGCWAWIFVERVRTTLTEMGCLDHGPLLEGTPNSMAGHSGATRRDAAAAA